MRTFIIWESLLLLVSLLHVKSVLSQTIISCSCDLTESACDANCCCDPDCGAADVSTFVCSTAALNEDSKLCVNTLVFVNNLPSTNVEYDSGAFCIIKQSDTSQNFYTEPAIPSDSADFDAAAQQYPTFTYDLTTQSTETTTNFYQTGDAIGIQYSNGLQGTFSFPVAGVSSSCLDSNPAAFMADQASSCSRRFNLSSECTSGAGSVLDALTYYSPSQFQIAQLPFINSTTTGSLLNITICNDATAPSSPSYDLGTEVCSNVTSGVSYTITYNGTDGIVAACASFSQLSTLSSSSLVQSFSVSFLALNTTENQTSSRSGNPGYVIGKPLRTASVQNNRTLSTELLTLLTANVDGTCSTGSSTRQIGFAEDARTGCLLSFTSTQNCSSLYTSIKSMLNEPTAAVVATYGNTLVNSSTTNDWLSVTGSLPAGPDITSTSTVSDATGCAGMLVGINYNVIFANTGSLFNPQPAIIGVTYSGTTKTVKFECFGTNCASAVATQTLEITSTVTFTDASSSPSTVLSERPTVNARLPNDFFFPFTG